MDNLHSKNDEAQQNLVRLIFFFSIIKIGIHLVTNAFASYGLFRDELYYLACADHLAWGYVDQPPLSIWVLAFITKLLGNSLFAIRFFPAFFSGASVFFFGMITCELGGKKLAISIVCVALIISGIHGSFSTFYSMNVIELLLWSMVLYVMVKILKSQNKMYWIFLGILLGLTTLNKISGAFLGAGILVSLLIYQRHWLSTRWPYIAAALALLIFSPYIIWNITHEWAHLEFIHNASTIKYAGMNPGIFWKSQILLNNPVVFPFALAGVLYFFNARHNKTYAFLFVIFLTVGLIYTINITSKPEYLASIFPVLVVGGALQFDEWATQKKWIIWPVAIVLLSGIPVLPLAIPILPIQSYISYASVMGLKQENSEGKETSELPQFYADMFGWEEQVSYVAKAYHSLSAEERTKCALYADNYGRAGAIDYYADQFKLPKSISGHNNYWLWGPREYTGEIVILLSDNAERLNKLFTDVEDVGIAHCQYNMPYENNLHIYICRKIRTPLNELWKDAKNFN